MLHMIKSERNPTIDTRNIITKHDMYYYEIPGFSISLEDQNRIYNKYTNQIDHYVGNNVEWDDDEVFFKIRSAYPWLDKKVTFSITNAGTIPMTHIDGPRNTSFNFPINNCGPGASTVWFDLPPPYFVNFMNEGQYGYYTVMGKKIPIAEYVLDSNRGNAALFRTTLPHCVVNKSRERRVIVTWTINEFLTIEEVIELVKNQQSQ